MVSQLEQAELDRLQQDIAKIAALRMRERNFDFYSDSVQFLQNFAAVVKDKLGGTSFGGLKPNSGQFGFRPTTNEDFAAESGTAGDRAARSVTVTISGDEPPDETAWVGTSSALRQLSKNQAIAYIGVMDINPSPKILGQKIETPSTKFVPTQEELIGLSDIPAILTPEIIGIRPEGSIFLANLFHTAGESNPRPIGITFGTVDYLAKVNPTQ